MSFGIRLREFRKTKKITQDELALVLKIESCNISFYENGKTTPSIQTLEFLSIKYNINLNWLLTGEGSMFLTPEPSRLPVSTVVESDTMLDDFVDIKIYDQISAGEPLHMIDSGHMDIIPIHKSLLIPPFDYTGFVVNGSSMAPEVEHGDYIVIKMEKEFDRLDGNIIAVNSDEGLTLKRFLVDQENKCSYLFPSNRHYKPTKLNKSHYIVGVLKLVIRKY